MNKRGQLQMSFAMIFSIIIIITTIAVGGYVINSFLKGQNCLKTAYFYDDLQTRIDKAYNAPFSNEAYTPSLDVDADYVCFGNLNADYDGEYTEAYAALKKYKNTGANVFLYPLNLKCTNAQGSHTLQHLSTLDFFCVEKTKGKVALRIVKESSEALVKVEAG